MNKLAIHGGPPVRTKPWPRWPIVGPEEERDLIALLRSQHWSRVGHGQVAEIAAGTAANDSFVAELQRQFARAHDCRYGVAATNGTVTLELALRALGLQPGDEVIVPPYTFVASATAVLIAGGIPIFVDIKPDTYNLDPDRIEEAITPRTRAIIAVHLGGQPCEMDTILAVARKHSLAVIEDAAHAHGAIYVDRKVGSIGSCGSFSFQASKNMTAGEGGIITTNDLDLAERCDSLVWGGRRKGQPWYMHFVLGGNYRLTEFQGAILCAQLGRLEAQVGRRSVNAAYLGRLLHQIGGLAPLTQSPTTSRNAYHLYVMQYDARQFGGLPKQKFCEALVAEGIPASTGYGKPLYKYPLFLEKNFFNGPFPVVRRTADRELDYASFERLCPVTEHACREAAVWLPQNVLLAQPSDLDHIAEAVAKVKAWVVRAVPIRN